MAGFIVYWSKDYVKEVEKAGDRGPFRVVYGSHHTVMPSIASVKAGDVVYPVTIQNGTLAVMARLPVEKIETAFDYTIRETGRRHSALIPEGIAYYTEGRLGRFVSWDGGCGYVNEVGIPDHIHTIYYEEDLAEVPIFFIRYQKPVVPKKRLSGEGSEIFPREIPMELVKTMLFGPSKSKEKPLRLDKNGRLTSTSLSGFVRKASVETMEVLEGAF